MRLTLYGGKFSLLPKIVNSKFVQGENSEIIKFKGTVKLL